MALSIKNSFSYGTFELAENKKAEIDLLGIEKKFSMGLLWYADTSKIGGGVEFGFKLYDKGKIIIKDMLNINAYSGLKKGEDHFHSLSFGNKFLVGTLAKKENLFY